LATPFSVDERDRDVNVTRGCNGVGLLLVPEVGRRCESALGAHEEARLHEALAERRIAQILGRAGSSTGRQVNCPPFRRRPRKSGTLTS
jgi:hypothetical protein